MSIVAIDFETANRFRNSACQVGAVLVQDGRVVDTYMSLIRPPGNFEAINIAVHGITASKVRSAPTLAAIWPTLKAFLGRAQRISAVSIRVTQVPCPVFFGQPLVLEVADAAQRLHRARPSSRAEQVLARTGRRAGSVCLGGKWSFTRVVCARMGHQSCSIDPLAPSVG